jgi:hydrogenase expression/formation protein HypE
VSVVSEREKRILGIIETARSKRGKFRDEQVTMAHGAGGKATQSLIEGLLVPAFGGETLEEMGDAGAVTVDGAELAMTSDSFVVKPLRFPASFVNWLLMNLAIFTPFIQEGIDAHKAWEKKFYAEAERMRNAKA